MILVQYTKNKLHKELKKLKKHYKDAFDFAFINYKDAGYGIKLFYMDLPEILVLLDFDARDLTYEQMPISYEISLKKPSVRIKTKSLKELIQRISSYYLR